MPCCMYLIILFLDFKGTATCSLVQRFPNDHPFEVAKGRAYRSVEGELLHHVPIEPGNAKVSVEYVPPYTETIKLPYPPNDHITTLHEARGTFIQWPRRDVLLDPQPTQSAHRSEVLAAASEGQQLAITETEPPRGKTTRSLPASTSKVQQKRKRESKTKSAKSVEKDYESAPLATQYVQGEAWVSGEELQGLVGASRQLHSHYLQECAKPEASRTTSIGLCSKLEHFNHEHLDGQFFINFVDLWEMYNYRQLESSIIKCYTL
jgi:hypothetical protein